MSGVRREFGPAVRSEALLRCKHRCESCGSRHDLQLHHVGYRADCSLFNCAVLCAACHTEEHQRRKERRVADT
jgi:hypothetical protein